MKGKASRPSHKAANTFVFRGFGEKVRSLRISARKYLLQRPKTEEGEDTTHIFEGISKARELNATEHFKAFLRELGSEVCTTNQLVHREEHVVKCFSSHIDIPESDALQPIFDLLVAFANDMPQEFYKQHFYHFLPKLVAHLSTKEPEQIESVFLCIVSLFVVLQKYLRENLYELYHVHNFSALLSKSYPWYVNELAAQSLGVLVRKVSNKDNFIGMSLRKLKKDESQVEGLGRVFAAMMKSDVIQRLHSCTPVILNILLEALRGEDEVPQEAALETVKYAVTLVARHITSPHPDKLVTWQTHWKEDASLVWPTLWSFVSGLLSQNSVATHRHLDCVLQVVQIFTSHKQGALITDVSDTVTQCLDLMEASLPDAVIYTATNILECLLTMSHDRLSSSALLKLISSFLASACSPGVKLDFMKKIIEWPRFDTEILPVLLPFLNKLMGSSKDPGLWKDIIEFIATVTVQKRPPCTSGIEISTWKAYPLDFSKENMNGKMHIGSFIENKIKEGILEDLSNLEDLSLCLLCLPHVLPLDQEDLAPYLRRILNDAISQLKDEAQKIVDSDRPSVRKKRKSDVVTPDVSIDMNIKCSIPQNTRQVLFLIGLVIEVMAHVLSNEDFLASLSQLELVDLMKRKHQYRENIHVLRAVDLHFTIASLHNETMLLTEEFLKDLYSFMAPALSSFNPQVRLVVLHIFSLFPVALPSPTENTNVTVENVFQILLKAECVPVTPYEFRDRLRFITMVDAEHVKPHTSVSGSYSEAPLLFLIGQLYINFKDVWIPVLKTISGFAHTMPSDVFWPLWYSKLKIASHVTQEVLLGKQVDPDVDLHLSCDILAEVNAKLSLHAGYSKISNKPDHLHYRDLLWKGMEKFPDVCETRNRDLVPLFFDFLEKEFFPVDFTVSPIQDISVENGEQEEFVGEFQVSSAAEDESMEVDVEQENEKNDLTTKKEKIDSKQGEEEKEEQLSAYPKRVSVQSLCVHLILFSKFHNPRMLTQTKKLETMYLELLTHPSPALQKISFDCLVTYNHPYLTPYKEHMYSLLEDKSFKNALTLFSIDGSEKVLEDDHRKDFMPYLMRILYGKMHFKTGSNSAGKSKTPVRKAVILRFLAGASEAEFHTFLELAFDVILGHVDGTALDVVNRSKEGLDLKRVVPLKRLQGALTTMENIIERVANRMAVRKSLLLKVILYIAKSSSLILERRSEVKKHHVSVLKHIRQQAQKQIVSYFSVLEDYSWQPDEIEAVFETMVWPYLRQLPDEAISFPTPLLRLFECWADHPRYFPLLAKVHKDDVNLTPLTYIVKLVTSDKCSDLVKGVVFNMVENLLTLKDHDEAVPDEEGRVLPLVHCPPTVEVKRLCSRDGVTQQNYGSALLVPHLDGLLQSMKNLIANLGKGTSVTKRDMTILCSLTEWVTSKEISQDLVSLIIPLLVNKHVKSDEVIAQLLKTCSYLLPLLDDSKQFLRPLIILFGSLEDRVARDALNQAVSALAQANPQFKQISDLAKDLNSWNPRMVEEPDFERRLDGHNQMTEYCKSTESICIDYCQFMVYNNMFVVCHVVDTSLRDMSRQCLDQVIDMCVRLQLSHPSEVKQILIDRLLSLIRNGLKIRKDEVRQDVIFLLLKMVHKCHSFHEKLADLYKLADESDDDSDFFSNMMHIQRHRRSRALMRLASKLKSGSIILTTETITDYLLPIVRMYLFNDDYAKDSHFLQGSVACIGAFALVLPWYPYLRMLKTYMAMITKWDLKYHKLLVKILEAVIDGFHEEFEEVKTYEKISSSSVKGKKGKNVAPVSTEQELGSAIKENKNTEKLADAAGKEVNAEQFCNTVEDLKEIELADLPVTADEGSLSKPRKVYLTIVSTIIPQIRTTLAARTKSDKKHKVNKKRYPEDEDIKRIPLAYALIKLMKKLPPKVLDANVSSVLMKMINFLKCQSQVIREEARIMLVKIMVELGGTYLPWLVSDMRSILTRGYQTHVLVFTLHSILSQMRPMLSSAHIDLCLVDMIEICKNDMLGLQAEEKNVMKITTKVKEARNDKSYAILNFTAEFISVQSLADLLMPLKDILAHTLDKKIVNKMVQCLDEIATGLERNANIELKQKSLFIYGVLNEKVTLLTSAGKKQHDDRKVEKIQRHDSYLLEPEPKKARLNPKATFETTSHVFLEFALKLLASLMRREKFSSQDEEHLKLLDPFVGVMKKCLNSDYPDISLHALKCINFLIKYPLPALKKQLSDICSEMFVILHKYSSSELTRGKLYELVQMTFRSLALIIKTVDYFVLNAEQVSVLLQYVQGSLDDSSHQTTVFAILQSIVARKIDAPELHELMGTVKKMSITCTRQYALNQARVTYYSYLLTYPMKKKDILRQIMYYLANISYSAREGRLSAQMFINGVITNFPVKMFSKELEASLWFKLSEQMVKEHFKENRILLHKSLKAMFERSERKSYLIELCMKLFGDDTSENVDSSAVAIQLSCKALSAFLDVSVKKMPQSILSVVLPKVVSLVNPSRYTAQMQGLNSQDDDDDANGSSQEFQEVDKSVVMLLEVLTKIVAMYLKSSNWNENAGEIWLHVKSLLLYPHIQVRLSAASLVGQLLAACPVDGAETPTLCSDTEKARSLVLDLCEVLQTQASEDIALMTQVSLSVVRNLIYLIRNACRVTLIRDKLTDESQVIGDNEDVNENESKEKESDPVILGSLWVMRRVGDLAYKELQASGKEYTLVREAFLNLMAGVIVVVGDKLQSPFLLSYIIKHLARELSDTRLPEKLSKRTQEVANLVKDHIGLESYTRRFTAAQVGLSKKRLERKAHENQLKLTNPLIFDNKKKKKRLASVKAKKLVIAERKGKLMKKSSLGKLRANVITTE